MPLVFLTHYLNDDAYLMPRHNFIRTINQIELQEQLLKKKRAFTTNLRNIKDERTLLDFFVNKVLLICL
jgi:hypothetical protein